MMCSPWRPGPWACADILDELDGQVSRPSLGVRDEVGWLTRLVQ